MSGVLLISREVFTLFMFEGVYTASDLTVFTFTCTFTEFLMQSETFISDCHMSKVIFFIASTVKKLVHISLTALFLPTSTYVFSKHSFLVS